MNTLKPLIINSKNFIYIIQQSDILYIKADGTYTSIVLANDERKIDSSKPLNVIKNELNMEFFLKISQSYFVSKKYLAGVNKKHKLVLLTTGHAIKYTIKINDFIENF